uniref:GDP-D-glucose phosphorylase 1 n=1 Tax=Chelonoidis abingdonii TaxID=106734 RepID=A0A8C0GSJ3_CHEAB
PPANPAAAETAPASPPPAPTWEPRDFVYGEEDFVLCGAGWWRSRSEGPASRTMSRFDRALQSGWEERMKLGLFRYHLGELQTRILPGNVRFVAQLNIQRGLERRKPQDIQSVKQKFDPQQFHFNKIKPEEILFHMVRSKLPGTPDCILVVINVSPLEFGHVLFIPDPALCLPQILTQELLKFGLESVLLRRPGNRAGRSRRGRTGTTPWAGPTLGGRREERAGAEQLPLGRAPGAAGSRPGGAGGAGSRPGGAGGAVCSGKRGGSSHQGAGQDPSLGGAGGQDPVPWGSREVGRAPWGAGSHPGVAGWGQDPIGGAGGGGRALHGCNIFPSGVAVDHLRRSRVVEGLD